MENLGREGWRKKGERKGGRGGRKEGKGGRREEGERERGKKEG